MSSEPEEWEMESRDSFRCSSAPGVVRGVRALTVGRAREGQWGECPLVEDGRLVGELKGRGRQALKELRRNSASSASAEQGCGLVVLAQAGLLL